MSFPIKPNCKAEFFAEIFGPDGGYFSDLKGKLRKQQPLDAKDAEGLFDDYCAIGEFLADRAAVLASLEPLERALRVAVKQSQNDQLTAHIKKRDPVFKSHKLLSTALQDFEIKEGFNNPNALSGTLHSQAYEYNTGTDAWEARFKEGDKGKLVATPTKLKEGVPTVVGGISGMDFNNILLRHGYQFKDVGASFRHGEYAHRLQWYAICQKKSALKLKNTPLQIYKSMGYLLAGGDGKKLKDAHRHLYIWETLFDAGKDMAQAHNVLKTDAWTNGTFNSPENLTAELIDPARDINTISDLWYLRTLVRTRYYKRLMEGPDEPKDRTYEEKAMTRRVGKAFTSIPMSQFPADLVNKASSFGHVPALIWYLTK